MKMKYAFIRNALAIGGLLVIIYLLFLFTSGRHMHQRLSGTWISECRRIEYAFNDSEYTLNRNSTGTFRVRGSRIIFIEYGRSYHVRVTRTYMILDGVHYLRND